MRVLMACVAFFLALACAPRAARRDPLPAGDPRPLGPALEPCLLVSKVSRRPLAVAVSGFAPGSWEAVLATVVLPHPSGLLLLDPAIGSSLAEDLLEAPFWFRLAVEDGTAVPTVKRMREAQLDPASVSQALLTHAHWDHAGALRELPNAKVRLARGEHAWVQSLGPKYDSGAFPQQLRAVASRLEPFDFDGPPLLGFPASKDLYGDGSVVALPLPGHTPGSTAFLVRARARDYLFVGDTVWSAEGYRRPAHKSCPVQAFADHDVEALGSSLDLLHRLHLERPELLILPSHDGAVLRSLPWCGGAHSSGR